jgi:hypothetical protein
VSGFKKKVTPKEKKTTFLEDSDAPPRGALHIFSWIVIFLRTLPYWYEPL